MSRHYQFDSPVVMSAALENIAAGLGTTASISGIMFTDRNHGVVAMLPDEVVPDLTVFVNVTPEEWSELLKISDLHLNAASKPWGRKVRDCISSFAQQSIWARDGFKCVYCGREMGEVAMTIDHFIPLEAGGESTESNLLSCCRSCNKDKADMAPEVWCFNNGFDYASYVAYLESPGEFFTEFPLTGRVQGP